MSATNAKSKSELQSRLGKRQKNEESMEEDAESPNLKQKPRSNHRHQHSNKKKKRDQSISSGSRDVDMDNQGDNGESDDESGEDNDDEDEYDDEEDDEEMMGFIAPDEEVEQEILQEKEALEKEYRKKNRKHKKKRAEPQLDEEDLNLLQENYGIPIQKKRRLQRNIDQDEDQRDQSDEEGVAAKSRDIVSREQRRIGGQRGQDMSDDEEQINTSTQNRSHLKARREGKSALREGYEDDADYDQERAARNIFQDATTLKNKTLKEQKLREQQKQEQKASLEELFDGDEIDDQFATKQDKAIAEQDIPERLQLKLGQRLALNMPDIEADIAQEVEWVFKRLLEETKRDKLIHEEQQAKRQIEKVLKYFRCDYSDIPYIVKYRKFEYQKELQEEDIQLIFNLDLEYGRFQQQLGLMKNQLNKLVQFDSRVQEYLSQIENVKNLQQLQNFSPLIAFLKSFYHEELQSLPDGKIKKVPYKQDHIIQIRKGRLDQCVKRVFLDPMLFIENLMNNTFMHKPPLINLAIQDLINPYISDSYPSWEKAIEAAMRFQGQSLSVQPYLRNQAKKHMRNVGTLSTEPTEQGKKDLDPFHPSYRVKRIRNEPLNHLIEKENFQDLFLDILQNEKSGLIKVSIKFDHEAMERFQEDLEEKYIPRDIDNNYSRLMKETLRQAVFDYLEKEIAKEIREELRQSAEAYVISQCQSKYQSLLMTGPFNCDEQNNRVRYRREDDINSIVPDRPRCTVMGVILQQIDTVNQLVSVAIVDQYGELVAHRDLQRLMPPRKFNMPQNQQATDEEDQRFKKAKEQHKEEEREHTKDRELIQELMQQHKVDLVVIGANKLAARQIKKTISEIAEGIKQFNFQQQDQDEQRRGSKRRGGAEQFDDVRKEAFVIWGSLEIPKLFANSHQSQKLLKGYHPILKQAICLARFEQDPMNEILNLWSFVPSENQALQIDLHPLQKLINQAKLSEALEEINIKCVNAVGIDLNLIVDHDHMHILLSFLSYFGPRKARQFISDVKSKSIKVLARGELYQQLHHRRNLYLNSSAFMKLRLTPEDRITDSKSKQDILDMTRIHPESYMLAHKIAKDVIYTGQEDVDMFHTQQALIQIIQEPEKLRQLDMKQYSLELERSDQSNYYALVEYIIQELTSPFHDPREYRSPTKQQLSNEDLFYMLIDESKKNFKRGIVVTATVSKVMDNMVICKLDNGLDATIQKNDLEKTDEKLQNFIQPGHVITGRINELKIQEEFKFGVSLNCQKKNLESHESFIDKSHVDPEDWVNQAFATDKKIQQSGKIIFRRIAHPKFKNINSKKAQEELQDKEIGEFIFRPSSKGENNITLTWKFYQNNFVHIDISEHDKPVGASIGSKLSISDEFFENLQEIVDRYIMQCNKNVREVCNNQKFMHFETQEELEKVLKDEKNQEPQRIPYKITILKEYPQHIVLGYIPKQSLIKEYIKVKPRGFYFHDKYHTPSQALINWFKGNYTQRDYIRQMKKAKSPRARALNEIKQIIPSNAAGGAYGQRGSGQDEWNSVSKDWRKSAANSVHSANNDDNNGNTEYASRTMRNQDHGRTGFNPGYSEYSQAGGRGGGGSSTCYNCNETGHFAKDCPQPSKQQQKSFGRGSKGTSYGRGQRRENQNDNDNSQSNFESSRPNFQEKSSFNDTSRWDDVKSKEGNDHEPMNVDSSGGWGNSNTPANNHGAQTWESQKSNNSTGFGNASSSNDVWGNNNNNNDGDNSPARSVRSNEGGRGRGRGGFGRGQGRGGGSTMECFKCQQTGHMARECPNPQSSAGRGRGGGGGRGACFKCNEEGHMARECPNANAGGDDGGRGRGRGRGRGGDRNCFKCGQAGHMSRDCDQGGDGDRPYKRQRRDDGGSSRREDNQDGQTNGGGWDNDEGNKWGNQDNAGSSSNWKDGGQSQNNQPSNWENKNSQGDSNNNASGAW